MDEIKWSPPVSVVNGVTLIPPTLEPDLYPYANGETLLSYPTATATGSSRDSAPPVNVGAAQCAAAVALPPVVLFCGPSL